MPSLGFPKTGAFLAPATPNMNPAMSTRGVFASMDPRVTATGISVLAQGGNAADAAIAGALAGAVVLQQLTSLGGDMFAVVHKPTAPGAPGMGEMVAFMCSGKSPMGASYDLMVEKGQDNPAGQRVMPQDGPLSVTVPGFVGGAFELLDRFGTRPFAELAEPAIGLARDGSPISVFMAGSMDEMQKLLARDPATAAVFMPGGQVMRPGQVWKQPDLARTLGEIAAGGPDAFYKGDIAERMAAYVQKVGGALNRDDFAGYESMVGAPLASTYRGYTIHETRLPTPGFVVQEALNIIENRDIAPYDLNSPATLHLVTEALIAAFADRNAYVGETPEGEAAVDRLLTKEWAAERYAAIDPGRASQLSPGKLTMGDTTSLVAIDSDGMMVSLIWSISNLFGSGVVAGDTGVLLNNRGGQCFSLEQDSQNVYAPGKRPLHTLNAYIISGSDGTPLAAGNCPGGDLQPQGNVQAIMGLIDGGLDVQAAAARARLSVFPATYPEDIGSPPELRIENRDNGSTLEALAEMGHNVVDYGPWGCPSAVAIAARDPETGVMAAAHDPRTEGVSIGL